MSSSPSFFDKLKLHNYSIITAIIIGILVAIYLMIIVPNNEVKEDANNIAIFKGIEGQLKSYVDEKLQGISPEQMDSIKKNNKNKTSELAINSGYYIDKIEIDSLKSMGFSSNKLLLTRKIYFKKNFEVKGADTFSIRDSVEFDFKKFIRRINASSNFKSFFICPVAVSKDPKIDGKCWAKEVLISQNISPNEEDSLCFYSRNEGQLTIEKSSKRFYSNQVRIPNTNFTLFLATGISNSYFQSNVQYIRPDYLILGLLVISILFLSICFIKPIVLSYKELLSQMDLIRVVLSIGALIGILTIYGMVGFWKTTISNRNKSDLKQLVNHIDSSFNNQLDTLKSWREHPILSDTVNGSKHPFKKLYLKNNSEISLINGDSLMPFGSFVFKIKENQIQLLDGNRFNRNDSLRQLKLLDGYFWMNKEGCLTGSLDKDDLSFPRNFNEREYFKLLQNKNIKKVLMGVFSRESNEYQWIYAERDTKINKIAVSDKFAIKGIAFREQFSKELKLPPDTDFMLVDRKGSVLAQRDPTKKLYQNVLLGSDNNLILASVLAGSKIENFQMDYQGNTYQVYAKKLNVSDVPVYILGIRNLTYLDYLGQFTFINAILIVLAHGLLIVLLILTYSSFFNSGHIGFFARAHFFHLFHNYSKKQEYQNLLIMNCICFLSALLVFLFSTPLTALYFSLLISLNITFINVIVLNISYDLFKQELKKFYSLVFFLSFVFPLILLFFDFLYLSIATIIATHVGFILYYKKWKDSEKNIEKPKDKIIQRKAYLSFFTSVLMNHFVMLPFILVCVFYSNEINDNARYYCSPSYPSTINTIAYVKKVSTYGCGCNTQEPLLNLGSNNEGIIRKLNFGFKDPTMGVINNYTINGVSKSFYIMIRVILTEAGANFVFIFLAFLFVLFLTYSLLNYYSNRFFFFDLMQVSYAGYYPLNKDKLTDEQYFIEQVFDSVIKKPKPVSEEEDFREKIKSQIDLAFKKDKKFEVIPFFRNEFILNSELKYLDESYSKIWGFISKKEFDNLESENNGNQNTQMQNVLFDFAQDSFSNYKNKDIIMELMDLGLINHNELTGRLQIRNESFRKYILLKSRQDIVFVEEFKKDTANGTFDKLRFPIFIIATTFLILLMYLNKDRYNQIEVMGTTITSVIVLVNRFLSMGKS